MFSRTNRWISNGLVLAGLLSMLGAIGVGCSTDGDLAVKRAQSPVVYGPDDRIDLYECADPLVQCPPPYFQERAEDSTVALVESDDVQVDSNNVVHLNASTLQQWAGLCDDEWFLNQPTAAYCSGTLIDDDLVLTAGHCMRNAADCTDTRLVFRYLMADEDNLVTITTQDLFSCLEIVVQEETNTVDYAIIRLDRAATPRFTPARVHTAAEAIPVNTSLVVIGCPTGLPFKMDAGSEVRENRAVTMDYFVANMDTFGGNSGSGTYRQDTEELVGILVRGETDYVYDYSAGCYRVNRCPDNGCSGEDSTYVSNAIEALCSTDPSPRLCGGPYCGDGNCDPGESSVNCPGDCGSYCPDGACNGDEDLAHCPDDCWLCGDGICTTEFESLLVCPDDCTVCEDGVCAGSEDYVSCPGDCYCGDDTCDSLEEEEDSCCTDCGCPAAYTCDADACTLIHGDGESCAGPLVVEALSGISTYPGDTSLATNDYAGTCASSGAPDQVYAFELDAVTHLDAQVGGYDTVMYLQSSCGDPDSELACDDDTTPPGDLGSRLLQTLQAGTYFLVVDGYGSNSGAYSLSLDFTPSTACQDAIPIAVSGTQSTSGDTSLALNDSNPGCATSNAPDDTFVFTLDSAYRVDARTSGFDTVLYLQATCLDPGSELACNDDDGGGGLGSHIDISLDAGTYYLFVDGYGTNSGSYDLVVTFTREGCEQDSQCDDGLYCNGLEICVDGRCQPGDPVTCPDEGVACTEESCHAGLDDCISTPDDSRCDDGLFCNGEETCDPGLDCVDGTPPCAADLLCDEYSQYCGCNFNGTCQIGEDCNTCPEDCVAGDGGGCGNGVCETAIGEDCLSCPSDCAGQQGGKPSQRFCCGDGDGQGPVGCTTSVCNSNGFACTNTMPVATCCGDLVCGGGEDSYNCEVDCGPPPYCGDGQCNGNEYLCSCPQDCGGPIPDTEMRCADGEDDDCDLLSDCADPDCMNDPACVQSCLPTGESCTSSSQCCSLKCQRGHCR